MRLAAVAALLIAAGAACAQPAAAPERGAELFRQCFACHSAEPGENTPAGPTLFGIVGRPIAAEPGFNYSPALRALAEQQRRWTPELLDRFIADPEAVAPGTEMGFMGLKDGAQRRALIDWLGNRQRDG